MRTNVYAECFIDNLTKTDYLALNQFEKFRICSITSRAKINSFSYQERNNLTRRRKNLSQ